MHISKHDYVPKQHMLQFYTGTRQASRKILWLDDTDTKFCIYCPVAKFDLYMEQATQSCSWEFCLGTYEFSKDYIW